jgi:hypothetical protein
MFTLLPCVVVLGSAVPLTRKHGCNEPCIGYLVASPQFANSLARWRLRMSSVIGQMLIEWMREFALVFFYPHWGWLGPFINDFVDDCFGSERSKGRRCHWEGS